MEPEGCQGPSTHSIVEEEAVRCGRYPFDPGGRTWLAKDQNGTLRIMGSRIRTPSSWGPRTVLAESRGCVCYVLGA